MENIRKLPEAEFDVMVTLWECKVSPVNTAYLMEQVCFFAGSKVIYDRVNRGGAFFTFEIGCDTVR